MAKNVVGSVPGLCTLSFTGILEQPSNLRNSHFAVVDENQTLKPASLLDTLVFTKGTNGFAVEIEFKARPRQCQLYVVSNARVIEVYGKKAQSTVARFLFSVNNDKLQKNSDLYETLLTRSKSIPNNTTVLTFKLLGLHPHRKGPCKLKCFRLVVPSEIFPTTQSVKQNEKTTLSEYTTTQKDSSSLAHTNKAVQMMMQCESGVSRRVLAKCEAILNEKIHRTYTGVQQAVGR